jgi:ABC-type phosphate transport system permease subunit
LEGWLVDGQQTFPAEKGAVCETWLRDRPPFFGLRPAGAAIVDTLTVLGVASAVSIPLGIIVAIFLVEFDDDWFAGLVRFVVDLMLQMPSIVVGIFVWSLLVRQVTGFAGIPGQ